ncbi:hypothetical protein EPN81_04330 [Patescibacteria group bacterium]|nr:MAG: hypothetical protein EPN81_04330 [Patescibacteria group bacterium]
MLNFSDELKKGAACDSVGKPESILGRTVCLSLHPGKMLLLPFIRWFDKRYRGLKFARVLFSFDLLLIGTLLGLGITALFLGLAKPSIFEDKILFAASVAPREIVTGAPSTLVIRYTNETDEELRNTKLTLTYPDHFLLQDLSVEEAQVEDTTIDLGTIPVGGSGSVRIRGVMFGDVGGEQSFTSTMTFLHGTQRDQAGKKVSVHTFSPSSSTLALTLTLPDQLVAFQEVKGTITYQNTGEIDFPTISIEPEWPNGFTFLSSPVSIVNGAFVVPAITAGETGTLDFVGYLGEVGEEVMFIFHPSFTFETSRYRQETLTHMAPVVPPQIRVGHSVDTSTIRPGAEAIFTVSYENTGEFDVTNLVLSIEVDSPFLIKDVYTSGPIETVAPGQSGEVQIRAPMRWSILQSETSDWDGLDLTSRATASYIIGDGSGQQVSSKGSPITSPITTPIVFESFGRYATADGDQLGRGPLPPRIGLETKYWVFWHVNGTINELQNVVIEGTLGEGVVFTGRQSSSQNSGVEYDASTNTVSWETSSIEPSLSPTSKIVGVAFELGLTPNETMVGKTPVLLYDIRISGIDARTGAYVSRSGATVTTNLPGDLMADGKGVVEN